MKFEIDDDLPAVIAPEHWDTWPRRAVEVRPVNFVERG